MADPVSSSCHASIFPSRLEAVQTLLDWFDRIRPADLDSMLWIQAQTALVEGFTNAVRHAHGTLMPPPPVQVSLTITPSLLRLWITDQGAPFDISSAWTDDARNRETGGTSHPSVIPSDADAQPELPQQDSQWGLIMLGRLRQDFGWAIRYEQRPDGGNTLVMERALA